MRQIVPPNVIVFTDDAKSTTTQASRYRVRRVVSLCQNMRTAPLGLTILLYNRWA